MAQQKQGEIKGIDTLAEFKSFLTENALVAVDFTATWCGPCRMIGPKFAEMAAEFGNIKFAKVDVDANSDTAEAEGISAMPTFKFYKNGSMAYEVVGASEAKLRESLQKLCG